MKSWGRGIGGPADKPGWCPAPSPCRALEMSAQVFPTGGLFSFFLKLQFDSLSPPCLSKLDGFGLVGSEELSRQKEGRGKSLRRKLLSQDRASPGTAMALEEVCVANSCAPARLCLGLPQPVAGSGTQTLVWACGRWQEQTPGSRLFHSPSLCCGKRDLTHTPTPSHPTSSVPMPGTLQHPPC